MSTSTFIEQLAAGQAADAKETLSNLLSARAFEALDARKQELGATLFGGQVEEEVEELDELSKATLGSYVNKASKDAAISSSASTNWAHTSGRARNPRVKVAAAQYSDEEEAREKKRLAGIGTAVNKLTK